MVRLPRLGEEESGRPQDPHHGTDRHSDGVILIPVTEELIDDARLGTLCVGLGNIVRDFEDLVVDGQHCWEGPR